MFARLISMRKLLLTAILLISVLHQSVFAMSSQALSGHVGTDLAHAVLHGNDEPHHHHDDGTPHQDSSDESFEHLQAEAASNLPGLASALSFVAPPVSPAAAVAFLPASPPAPILESLRRPPRLPA